MIRFLTTTHKFRSNEVGVLGNTAEKKMTDDHPDNQKLTKSSGGDDSPVDGRRRCTDLLFLLLLICSWVAMTGVGMAATGVIPSEHIKKGDPRRLVNGMDYYGNLCGVTNYETPSGNDTINLPKAYPMPSGFAVCVEQCPKETNYDKFICEYDVQHEIDNLFGSSELGDVVADEEEAKRSLYLFYASRKQCMPQIESLGFLGYCIPKLPLDKVILTDVNTADNSTETNSTEISTDVSIPIASKARSKSSDFFVTAMADVTRVRHVIFGFGCGMALVLGIIFLIIIQLPGFLSLLVWSMIFAIDLGLAAAAYYTKDVSLKWAATNVRPGNEAAALFYASYVLYGLAGIWLLVVLGLRKRIVLAISCVREAAKAIASMPVITVFPVFQVLGLFAFTIVWGVYMAFLASSGEVVANCMCPEMNENATLSTVVETVESNNGICDDGCLLHKELVYAKNTKYAGLYLLFVWFWTSQFIVAVGQLIVASATSLWYFSRNRGLVKNATFFRAVCLVSFNHLGTAAFGSLIIAIVKTIRAILTYVQKRAAKSKLRVAIVILSVLKCLLWCVEKCLKYINKQAYIQTAIFGYSFCKASRMGFFLILRNALRISAVSVVSQIVLFIGKVFITVASAVGGYYYLEIHFGDELNYLMVPTLLIAIVAFAVAEMFNEVFGMAISTILQCFVADEELFDAEDRFAPDSLAGTIDSTQKKYKKKKKVGVSETN
ncbi:hypothetical protein ACHAXR_009764 [Thalassiosira sp. AJA248-18]